MKDLSLHQAAQRLGLTRPELIKRMRAAGLLDSSNLPAVPVRDRLYLRAKETSWHHPELGMQYSHSTKVRPAGVAWLADKLGIPRVCAPAAPDRREVG
ncbi:TPA: phage antirepressor KilAC domain-containing protein [Pseudomonas aeruginosa]|uniref:phage antirepressor KilAC domain-containing protein n=1 Tax=Pseudomonas aeruginosa TaxID=287 RepID=UPI000EB5805B|nr:phage antirepressor KilAC domain-containing protein [Pseudomonas aeruginosa]EKW4794709.1 phage antirepressor KilAC domain-containing protein [Pseudomonas aeruginosa]MCZ9746987.1 phage antirepressor KilAC domain-containing protein [Pseudomonas aeruginosa]RPW71717.1 DNA-binding protein [Pseudomonas aeruginosa]WHW04079.1 phage antirepressor KilAC domain-containing protein [Pseudomonas aeruginosa]WPD44718.1 phage antirepressor KilAC domain-containing protein [Pseudomonas aeruginosa]